MRNTGIVYESSERKPATAPAFSGLLPPLPGEQYAALESDILRNGCYSPIIVNEDHIIIDGYHRYAVCEKHGLPYRVAVFAFADDLEARQWALETQKARRNLSAWEIGQIVLKLKPEIEAKAKEKMAAGGGDKVSAEARAGFMNSQDPLPEEVNTTKELAAAAGIGAQTMNRIIQIGERAPGPVKSAMDDGLSVNAGYTITRLLEKLPEESREAAAERAVEFAKQRGDYKAAFDIDLRDMNALVKENTEAPGVIRAALRDGGLSVNGGRDVALTLLDMPEDVRESAAVDAVGLAELEADYRAKSRAVDASTEIAKAYNAAFECAAGIVGTEREVRAWIEWSGIRKDEITGLAGEAEGAAAIFSQIAAILRKIYTLEVSPYESVDEGCQGEG